jgi:DNA polymerase III psi subunit
MIEQRRRAYLDALGIDVWLLKPSTADRGRLVFSPGGGSTLLVCDSAEAAITRLACDVVRALGDDSVWAWPDPECAESSPSLEQAVARFLFTRVVIFGHDLGSQLFKGASPEVIGSARISIAPGLEELSVRGTAKQEFWNQVSGNPFN